MPNVSFARCYSREFSINRLIHPRRLLTPQDILIIRDFYQDCCGVRSFIAGYAILIFRSEADIKRAWSTGIPDSLGGLDVGYGIRDHMPTTTVAACGIHVKGEPNPKAHRRGCLGAKIKLPCGTLAITVVTHGFVRLPNAPPCMVMKVADWMLRVKCSLSQFISSSKRNSFPGRVESRGE